MTSYLLDTNVVSMLVRNHPVVVANVIRRPVSAICISAITEAELRGGLARMPEAGKLGRTIEEFLRRVDIQPWDSPAALCYANLGAQLQRDGKALEPFDMLICAHAIRLGITLVSNDQAFRHVENLSLEDWTRP